jgi:flagellar basal-body rod protein FlgG
LGARLDLEPGEIVLTGRSFDVAIHGGGWFAVSSVEGVRYTRCGRLLLDDQRRLCASTARGPAPLEPQVELPAGARQIRLREDGAVYATSSAEGALVKYGQIQLAHVPEPATLTYQSDGLLQATAAAAISMAMPGQADVGTLVPNALERSNVDPEAEARAIERIDRWLQAVRH